MDGKCRHQQEHLLNSTSASPGLLAVGHAMGRSFVCGYNIAIRAKFSTKDLYGLVDTGECIVRRRHV